MTASTYTALSLEFDHADHVATITLRQPETLNAMTRQLTLDLRDALDELS